MSDKPHYHGHRQRLRERFRRGGFQSMADYEALEMLLCYAIPRRDVKPLAKALIKRFGSIGGVLDAGYDELTAVEGVSEYTATLIGALKECAGLYLRERKVMKRPVLSSARDVIEYCTLKMAGLKDEQFRVMFLNSTNEVVADEVIAEGTVNETSVSARKIMERALVHKATALILAHNHPGGSCRPSRQDEALTTEIVRVARGLNIIVHDHLIICREDYYSFRTSGMLR